eukprot:11053811-Prorocentrum_lima.AAC.1
MTSSLVGSEMCIRDRSRRSANNSTWHTRRALGPSRFTQAGNQWDGCGTVSYTHLTLPTICSV